jgi:hypothetical protein
MVPHVVLGPRGVLDVVALAAAGIMLAAIAWMAACVDPPSSGVCPQIAQFTSPGRGELGDLWARARNERDSREEGEDRDGAS